jgi:hypothetical protein
MTINPVKSLVTTVLRRPSQSLASVNRQNCGLEATIVRRKQKFLITSCPWRSSNRCMSNGSKAAGKKKSVTQTQPREERGTSQKPPTALRRSAAINSSY